MVPERQARQICDALVQRTKAHDAVVRVRDAIETNQRFAANAFTTNGSSRERSFSVTVWIDKRQGSASGTERAALGDIFVLLGSRRKREFVCVGHRGAGES